MTVEQLRTSLVYKYLYPLWVPIYAGMPCYIGKGSSEDRYQRNLIYDPHPLLAFLARANAPAPLEVVIIQKDMLEDDALDLEIELILSIGTIEKGGPLLNRQVTRSYAQLSKKQKYIAMLDEEEAEWSYPAKNKKRVYAGTRTPDVRPEELSAYKEKEEAGFKRAEFLRDRRRLQQSLEEHERKGHAKMKRDEQKRLAKWRVTMRKDGWNT
jgi:hypothetical protein